MSDECAVCPLLRKRLHDVEEAAENLLAVFGKTGDQRLTALTALANSMVVDFDVAILSGHDISDVHRKFWLAESEKHEAGQPPEADRGTE